MLKRSITDFDIPLCGACNPLALVFDHAFVLKTQAG
jgi:hypothetical protein